MPGWTARAFVGCPSVYVAIRMPIPERQYRPDSLFRLKERRMFHALFLPIFARPERGTMEVAAKSDANNCMFSALKLL